MECTLKERVLVQINLADPEWILERIIIGLQSVREDNHVKRPCELEGLEYYMMITDLVPGGSFTIHITKEALERAGIEEKEAWDRAVANTCEDTQIMKLDEITREILGMDLGEEEEDIPFYVITNQNCYRGAGALVNKNLLRPVAEKYGADKLVILPSSVHELIVGPYKSDEEELQTLSALVKQINEHCVNPKERLTDRAYVLSVKERMEGE